MVETNHLAYIATVAGSAEECTALNSLRFVSLKKKMIARLLDSQAAAL